MKRDSTAATELAKRLELETYVPARAAGFVSDVVVPAAQALLAGLFASALITFLISQLVPNARHILIVFIGIALFVASLVYPVLLYEHRRLLWAIERKFNIDLDHDRVKGPPPGERTIRVELHNAGTGHTSIVSAEWLEMDDENLIRFARGLLGGRGLTEGEWNGDPAFPAGINDFRKVRTKLESGGNIRRVTPGASNSTWVLTFPGRALMKRIADWDFYEQTIEAE